MPIIGHQGAIIALICLTGTAAMGSPAHGRHHQAAGSQVDLIDYCGKTVRRR